MIIASSGDFGISFLLEFVSLFVIGGIVYRYIWPLLKNAMDKSAEKIRSQLAVSEDMKARAATVISEQQSLLEAAKAEATAMIEQARHTAVIIVEEGERHAGDEYQRLVRRAEADIESARRRMIEELLAATSERVLEIAQVVVEAELDSSAQHRLVDQVIGVTESDSVKS